MTDSNNSALPKQGIELALALAAQGWYIFPCRESDCQSKNARGEAVTRKAKSPYWNRGDLPNGKDNATLDPALIRRWWGRWPGALIGIYCQRSGIFALDIDIKNGLNGDLSLEGLVKQYGAGVNLSYGPGQLTPSGGKHLIFAWPDSGTIPNNAGQLAQGLDLRSNGYICTGTGYNWLPNHTWNTPLTQAPGWLLTLIQSKPAKSAYRPAQANQNAADYWLSKAQAHARVGNRNDTGLWLACQLRDSGLSISEAKPVMLAYADTVPVPGNGYNESEALASLESAYSTPPRAPATRQAGAAIQPAPTLQPSDAIDSTKGGYAFERIKQALDMQETGDAALLADLASNRAAYDHALNTWYLWAGNHWQQDQTGAMYRIIANELAPLYLHAAAEAQAGDNAELSKSLAKRAAALRTKKRMDNVIYLAARTQRLALTGSEWDQNPLLLGTNNGVIDLRNGNFRPGQPGDYILSYAPTDWQGLDTPAPAWEAFLLDIFADPAICAFVQRLLGYGISGKKTERILPILWGEGANGKSTLIETIGAVLGRTLTMATEADSLMDVAKGGDGPRPFVYALRGKRLVWASESNEGRRMNTALAKKLSGRDTITVRTLHAKPVIFDPTHLILLITNHRPNIPDDIAMWDRVILLPFTARFVEHPRVGEKLQDRDIQDKLRAEAPGILAWLVRGYLAWQREGLNPPEAIKAATKDYQASEDTLAQFVADSCVELETATVLGTPLFKAYMDWCSENNIRPMSNTAFGTRMGKKYRKEKKPNGMTYYGIGLIADA